MAAEEGSGMANEKIVIIEATVPTGFEEVAREEAVEKFGLEGKSARGKILFRVPFDRVKQVLQLGGIDNCRVQTLHVPDFGFTEDAHDCLSRLQLLVRNVDWSEGLEVWREFFSFPHHIAPVPEKIPTDEELIDVCIMKRKPQPKSGGKKGRHKKDRKNKKQDGNEKGDGEKLATEKSDEAQAVTASGQERAQEEPSPDESASFEEEKSHDTVESPEKGNEMGGAGDVAEPKSLSPNVPSTQMSGGHSGAECLNVSVSPHADNDITSQSTSHTEVNVPEQSSNQNSNTLTMTDGTFNEKIPSPEKQSPPDLENMQQEQTDSLPSEGAKVPETPTPPKQKDPTKPAFRVTCNRTGERHSFDSMSAAASFGSAVQTYFSWNVDMKNFNIEVILNIDHEEVSVGIGLTQASLHYRNLVAFGVTTLRPTICYNMLRMCKIRDGHVVCDPMCGSGSIPIQGALGWPKTIQLCGENFHKALEKTAKNKEAIDQQRQKENSGSLKMDIVQWDACRLPLRDGAVDIFVSDLPFGHRVGSKMDNRKLYPAVLEEMARVGRFGSRACLLTGDKTNFIKAIQQNNRYWQRRRILSVNIGGIAAAVFLLLRTTTPFSRCSKFPPKHHGHRQHDHADLPPPHPSFTSAEEDGDSGSRPTNVSEEGSSGMPPSVPSEVPPSEGSFSGEKSNETASGRMARSGVRQDSNFSVVTASDVTLMDSTASPSCDSTLTADASTQSSKVQSASIGTQSNVGSRVETVSAGTQSSGVQSASIGTQSDVGIGVETASAGTQSRAACTTDASTQSIITGAAFLDRVGTGGGGGDGGERPPDGDDGDSEGLNGAEGETAL